MKLANNIQIRVFCKKDENSEEILNGIYKIIDFSKEDLAKEKLEIKKSEAKGFEEKITIYEFVAEKERHTKRIIKHLNEKIGSDKKYLLEQENRIDKNMDFFLRLSKPSILENSFELTDSGDCYHIKINVAAFPKNIDAAKEKVKEMFS